MRLSPKPDPEPARTSRKQHHERTQPRFYLEVRHAAQNYPGVLSVNQAKILNLEKLGALLGYSLPVAHICDRRYAKLAVLVLSVLLQCGSTSAYAAQSDSTPAYAAKISNEGAPINKYPFEKIVVPITIENVGSKQWNSTSEEEEVFLLGLLVKSDGKVWEKLNFTASFEEPVLPGETASLDLRLESSEKYPSYLPVDEYNTLVYLVVQSLKDSTRVLVEVQQQKKIQLNIIQPTGIALVPEFEKSNGKLSWYVEGDWALNFCSLLVEKTMEGNRVSFSYKGDMVYGFSAGFNYPEIWIRDSATIMPLARYLYPKPILTSWIKAHLKQQMDAGDVADWIRVDGMYDKNTVESDQESSLVLAAYEVSKSVGYDWLVEKDGKFTVLARLSRALNFLFEHRMDPQTGLIKSGHTADWGDVSHEFEDHLSSDLQQDSKEVVGIYTNALAHGAALRLAELFDRTADGINGALWRGKAEACAITPRRTYGWTRRAFSGLTGTSTTTTTSISTRAIYSPWAAMPRLSRWALPIPTRPKALCGRRSRGRDSSTFRPLAAHYCRPIRSAFSNIKI